MSDIQTSTPNLTEEKKKIDYSIVWKFLKPFLIGYSLPVIPSLLSLFIKRIVMLINNKGSKTYLVEQIYKILTKTHILQFGLSFGVMGASYSLLTNFFNNYIQNKVYSSFFAGAIAGLGITLDSSSQGRERRLILSLYLFVRGLEMIYHTLISKKVINEIEHLDTILFTTSCFEIMISWFYYPYSLPKEYNKWITTMSEVDPILLSLARLQKDGGWNVGQTCDLLNDYSKQLGHNIKDGNPLYGLVNCKYLHPFCPESCTKAHSLVWLRTLKRSMMLYGPVHFLPLLIFKNKILIKDPITSIRKLLIDIFRSSSFLATFVALIWMSICFWRNLLQEDTLIGPVMGAFLCGLSVLIEKKHRRMELALYCIPRALHSIFEKLFVFFQYSDSLKLNRKVQIGTILFSLGLGMITSTLECEPHVIGTSIRNFLLYFFGK